MRDHHAAMVRGRRSIRLPNVDYAAPGDYFLTIVTHQRAHLFGEILDDKLRPSPAGQIVERAWHALPDFFDNLKLDAFVVMPDHLHGIVWITDDAGLQTLGCNFKAPAPLEDWHATESGSLGAIVQNFKSITTRKINQRRKTPQCKVWLRNYWERIVRDEAALRAIRRYIEMNPAKWSAQYQRQLHTIRR